MLPDPPTVICCGNDEMAMKIYGVLRVKRLAIAEAVSIAGYDNHQTIAETLYPPLTTIGLPYKINEDFSSPIFGENGS